MSSSSLGCEFVISLSARQRFVEIEETLYNLKLHVFKLSGEQTNHSENEQIYHSNFIWYVERSSSGDINPISYHLKASELLINQLLYINFPSLERKIFLKHLKSTLPSSVALRNSTLPSSVAL